MLGNLLQSLVVIVATGVASVASGASVASVAGDAREVPVLPGWIPFGQVELDAAGCRNCPMTFTPTRIHRSFGFATDSPFPILLNGQVDVVCANGETYNAFLRSPLQGGLFQVVPNLCVNFQATKVTVDVTSVSLPPPIEGRHIALIVYGSFG